MIRTDSSRAALRSILNRAASFSAAALYEAGGRVGALPCSIKPVSPGWQVCGPAFPVLVRAGDNLWLHQAIYTAKPGDILVVSTSGHYEAGYWGEVMTRAAIHRKIRGVVIDGCCRDISVVKRLRLPIFSRGACIRSTSKEGGMGGVKLPIEIGDTKIEVGDLVRGDSDGVVVIPRVGILETLQEAHNRVTKEANVMRMLRNGRTTMEVFGWRPPV